MMQESYFEQFIGDIPLWDIEQAIEEALDRDGELLNMPIIGGNYPNEKTIRRNIFSIKWIRFTGDYNQIHIHGKWIARNLSGHKVIRKISTIAYPSNTLSDLRFYITGEIPQDFL